MFTGSRLRHRPDTFVEQGLLRFAAPRAAVFALLWWVLTEGEPSSWWIGVPIVIASALASWGLRAGHAWSWRPVGLARFLAVFLWESFRGGLDVAFRALHPRRPLAPDFKVYTLRLPVGPARVFLANTLSLLPGTLSADIRDECLTVHVLDGNLPVLEDLPVLEVLVADLFGLSVEGDRLPREPQHG